jgi:ABC-type phosphate transport system auxiliary subunit
MRTHSRRRAPRFLLAGAALSAVLAAGATAQAQRSVPTRDLSGSERDLSALERESNAKKRDPKNVMAEINEDFERLRAINEGFRRKDAPAALDYKTISLNTAEVKKRAARLKTNLAGLPKPEKEEKRQKAEVPSDDAQMKALLSSFGELMNAFLNNPVFSDMGTIDTQLALKARRDLDSLIDMCEVVRKGADQLGKRAGQ